MIWAMFLSVVLFSECRRAPDTIFTLKGEIEGLRTGDTLFLTAYSIPEWQSGPVGPIDTIYVEEPGSFSYAKPLQETAFYLLTYRPYGEIPQPSCILGESILAKAGETTTVKGSIHYLGAWEKDGGFYKDSLVNRLEKLTNTYNRSLIDIYDRIMQALKQQQPDSVDKYGSMYNMREKPLELRELEKFIAEEVQDNEFAVYLYLNRQIELPFGETEARYARFSPEIKKSKMGRHLEEIIEKRRLLEPGHTPPDFEVKTPQGKTYTLSHYQGRYLLLYYWGLCPGTFAVQPKLLELYKNYHAKGLDVLGCSMDDFTRTQPQLLNNVQALEEIGPLLNQPWENVYFSDEDNEQLGKDYNFTVLPTLMLISPEGKVLVRGYGKAYDEIQEILRQELTDSGKL